MHRDPTLRRRNALVIPGVLLTLFSLEGMAYAAWFRPDTVECGDGGLIVLAYACRRVALLLLAPLVLGLILTVVGALQRSKTTCHLGHGTVATTGLAVLVTSTLVPLLATLGLYAMEDPAAPFVMTYEGVEYGQVRILALLTGILGLALVPFVLLYVATARPRACCREKKCFEPCFCDEVVEQPQAPEPVAVAEPIPEELPYEEAAEAPMEEEVVTEEAMMEEAPPEEAEGQQWAAAEPEAVVEEVPEEDLTDAWPEPGAPEDDADLQEAAEEPPMEPVSRSAPPNKPKPAKAKSSKPAKAAAKKPARKPAKKTQTRRK